MINLEREFKSEISRKSYDKLIEKYDLNNKIYKQINYYFDTKDFALQSQKSTLRIREKDISIHLTFKAHKAENTVLETTYNLGKNELDNYLQNGFKMTMFNLDLVVYNYANLTTLRAKFKYDLGTIFIDHNMYFNKEDYEIEFEINDGVSFDDGLNCFNKFLNENNIEFRKQISKNKRAYNEYKAAI